MAKHHETDIQLRNMDHLVVEFTGPEHTATVLYHRVVNRSYCSTSPSCSEHPCFEAAYPQNRSLTLQMTEEKSQI